MGWIGQPPRLDASQPTTKQLAFPDVRRTSRDQFPHIFSTGPGQPAVQPSGDSDLTTYPGAPALIAASIWSQGRLGGMPMALMSTASSQLSTVARTFSAEP